MMDEKGMVFVFVLISVAVILSLGRLMWIGMDKMAAQEKAQRQARVDFCYTMQTQADKEACLKRLALGVYP